MAVIAGKNNAGLVKYAQAQLGRPYWYGTFGNIATASLYEYKKKQYASTGYYTKWKDYSTQYGKRVHDCVGLIKGYIWSDTPTSVPKYNAAQDKSASGMYSASTVKGKIDTFPMKEGQLVYKSYSKSDAKQIHHVGVYVGGGYVIEAMGHEEGVVKTKFTGAGWTHWSQCPYISETASTVPGRSYSSSYAGTYKVTGALVNLRAGAGTSEKIVKILTKGTEAQCDGEFVHLNGTVWYHVTAKSGSKTYEGFMSEKYLKKK